MKTVDSEDEEEEGNWMSDVGFYISDRHILGADFSWLSLILNKI